MLAAGNCLKKLWKSFFNFLSNAQMQRTVWANVKANDLSAAGHRGCGAWQLPQKHQGTSQKQVVWMVLIEEQRTQKKCLSFWGRVHLLTELDRTRLEGKRLEKACCEAAKGVGGR